MRLPDAAHTDQPWRIHAITGDFRLEDVWALPDVDRLEDFPRLIELLTSYDPASSSSPVLRALVAIRWKLGALFDLDRATGSDAATLRHRLPADLRAAPPGPASAALPLRPLYLTEDEWAAEVVNRTVHGVLHIGLVPGKGRDGRFRAQMAILVKPNGRLGAAYLAAIKPFRHLLVYPTILREGAARWRALANH